MLSRGFQHLLEKLSHGLPLFDKYIRFAAMLQSVKLRESEAKLTYFFYLLLLNLLIYFRDGRKLSLSKEFRNRQLNFSIAAYCRLPRRFAKDRLGSLGGIASKKISKI